MSEQPTTPGLEKTQPLELPQGAEWFWWGLLIVSLAVGFGLTMFAPI